MPLDEPGRPRRATGADVAKLAGVSRATVSYVLNAVPNQTIPEATRQRVREAAAQLRYQPSPTARSLRSGRSQVVLGLLGDAPPSPLYQQSFNELSQALAEHGFLFLVHPHFPDSLPLTQVWQTLTPAAVFSLVPLTATDVMAMGAAGISVAVAATPFKPQYPWEVSHGDEITGVAQAEHLIARGHRHATVVVPEDPRAQVLADGRITGVRRTFADAGHPEPGVLLLPADPTLARRRLADWRTAHPAVTAMVAWDDILGAKVTSTAMRLGWSIPADLAVIGAYDYPEGAWSSPPLTTIRSDIRAAMRVIGASIAAAVAGEPPTMVTFDENPLTVVQRSST